MVDLADLFRRGSCGSLGGPDIADLRAALTTSTGAPDMEALLRGLREMRYLGGEGARRLARVVKVVQDVYDGAEDAQTPEMRALGRVLSIAIGEG